MIGYWSKQFHRHRGGMGGGGGEVDQRGKMLCLYLTFQVGFRTIYAVKRTFL